MGNKNNIEFIKVPIARSYGKILNDIYIIFENGRCKVLKVLEALEERDRADIIDLISRLATIEDFKSPKIRKRLKKYNYGEIKPWGHRFFYFKKYGSNLIFFAYREKKKDSLGASVYKKLEKEKQYYEREFEKFYK